MSANLLYDDKFLIPKLGRAYKWVLLWEVKFDPRSPLVGGEFNASMYGTLLSETHVPMAEVCVEESKLFNSWRACSLERGYKWVLLYGDKFVP